MNQDVSRTRKLARRAGGNDARLEEVAAFKHPRQLVVLDVLPKTAAPGPGISPPHAARYGRRMQRRSICAVLASLVLFAACTPDQAADPTTSATASTPQATNTVPAGTVAVTTVPVTTVPVMTVPVTTVPVSTVPVSFPSVDGLPPLPPQPDGVPFPTLEWPTGDLPATMSKATVDTMVDAAFSAPEGQGLRSLLVVVGGKVVYERYRQPDTADSIMSSYSVAKSFTSATIGLLAGDGRLDVEAAAERAEWSAPDDPRHEITVDDLLRMSSGLEWLEGAVDYQKIGAAPDGAAFAASRPLVGEPGTTWNYSTATTAILASIAAAELGGGDELEAYVRERLLDPIGITSTSFTNDPTGTWWGGFGADSTVRDFARFGLLFLRDGVWDGERLLPEGWVDYSRTPSPTSDGYGAQWWIGPDNAYFEASGLYGQRIRVSPALDAVLVATSYQGGDSDGLLTLVLALLADAAAQCADGDVVCFP